LACNVLKHWRGEWALEKHRNRSSFGPEQSGKLETFLSYQMKNSLRKLVFLLLPLVIWGCGRSDEANDVRPDSSNLNAGFWLSKAEQTELKNKARAGDGEAAFRLSRFFRFMRHDKKEETKWLKLSAENGSDAGIYNYAFVLRESSNNRDNAKSVKWFRLAAEKGLAEAAVDLGEIYETGNGVPSDLRVARQWYEKAAKAGHLTGGEKFLEFLADGKGGKTQLVPAYAWARLMYSRLEGSVAGETIHERMDKLRNQLNPDELSQAEKEFASLQKSVPLEPVDP
jgi:hypothetical protein